MSTDFYLSADADTDLISPITENAGTGGVSTTGAAYGGNSYAKRTVPGLTPFIPFGVGGAAQSGNSGSVNGGGVSNTASAILNGKYASKSNPSSLYT